MIGKTISHYRIIEKLGEGGMGAVYKAEDQRLGRAVAIKLLPAGIAGDEATQRRLIAESRAAAILDHPNICTIHAIEETEDGRLFMVMAYYEGATLREVLDRGPLELSRAIDIAIGVARGLASAHERKIVHRDIKPSNIMVTRDGTMKILDFGIAKLAGETREVTRGALIGTIAYMSPEQARGGTIDHRTDIWSLGAVLYEMATGRRPFAGDYDQAVVYAILNEEPKPVSSLRPEAPRELDRIVGKALEKSPANRWRDAGEMAAALERLLREWPAGGGIGAGPASGGRAGARKAPPSIAVLPFKDMSPQQDQEYFCEGIAEEITNALVQIDGLSVAARTSASQFKGKAMDVKAIGRELDVENVLEGSVRKAGEKLRITAQLVSVADGYHLFSEKYDRAADDIFAIQDEIALAIVDRLKVKLASDEKEKLVRRRTENEEAYRLYLQGRYLWNRRHEGGLRRAMEFFQKAIEIDPEYVLPYSGIADSYFDLGWYDFLSPGEAFGKSKEIALRAIEMDPDSAEARCSLAVALWYNDWNWEGAEAEFERSFELNPKYATARHFHSLHLSSRGRHDEALDENLRALELDPLTLLMKSARVFTLYQAGRFEEAIEYGRASLEDDPNVFSMWANIGLSCIETGNAAEAETALRKANELIGGTSTLMLGILCYVLARGGKTVEAREALERLLELRRTKWVSSMLLSSIHSALGETDAAFEWIERGIGERDHWCLWAKSIPMLGRLRSDSRFGNCLRRLDLATGARDS